VPYRTQLAELLLGLPQQQDRIEPQEYGDAAFQDRRRLVAPAGPYARRTPARAGPRTRRGRPSFSSPSTRLLGSRGVETSAPDGSGATHVADRALADEGPAAWSSAGQLAPSAPLGERPDPTTCPESLTARTRARERVGLRNVWFCPVAKGQRGRQPPSTLASAPRWPAAQAMELPTSCTGMAITCGHYRAATADAQCVRGEAIFDTLVLRDKRKDSAREGRHLRETL
jgi:hypothetical protein